MTHFEHLRALVPDLVNRRILDLGAGEGRFAVEAASAGPRVTGLEYYDGHIKTAEALARKKGVGVPFIKGKGEALPFPDASFDFINMAEVIEHVEDPDQVLREAFRVLAEGGLVYLSAPNRFGLKDPHFQLYFINWMPRFMVDHALSLFQAHKDYARYGVMGEQRLSQMHYYTYGGIVRAVRRAGFHYEDIRLKKIKQMALPKRSLAQIAYALMRPWYFDSFHLLLSKK